MPLLAAAAVGVCLCFFAFAAPAVGPVPGAATQPPTPEEARQANAPPLPPPRREGELLVRFRPGLVGLNRAGVLRRAGVRGRELPGARRFRPALRSGGDSVFAGLMRIRLTDPARLGEAMARLRQRPEVAWVEPNYLVHLADDPPPLVRPDDFEFERQWALENTGQLEGLPGHDMSAPAAWSIVHEAPDVLVAVIDSGIDYFHPDLEPNVWINADELPGNGLDDDGNGYVDDVRGYDFVSGDGDPMDDQGHGTHVAGIIGARGNNGIGVTGLCWDARLMAIKAFDEDGQAAVSDVVEAIEYAVANGARLMNASWGLSEESLALQEAIHEATAAGLLVISAAGNGRTDDPFYPAALEDVVAVAATDNQDERAGFSNFGPFVDLAAPGELILSTMPNARYDYLSGTSMAAPQVTGVAALVLARHPDFTGPEVVEILRNSVDEIAPDHPLGTGRINALKAVRVSRPLPTARLELPELLSGLAELRGTAAGADFARYELDYGTGAHPEAWTTFHRSTTPVVDGPLIEGWNTAVLREGEYTLRLRVTDTDGQTAVDRAVVTVRNVYLSAPRHNDFLRAGEVYELRGSVFGAGRTYTIEQGRGRLPSAWSAAGITLIDGGRHPVTEDLLGWWDTAGLEPNQFFTLRVMAREDGEEVGEWMTHLVYLDGHLRAGWPQYLPTDAFYPTNDWRDVVVADLDVDGRQEILRVHTGGVTGTPAELKVFDLDGSVRWSAELGRGEPYSDIPAVGDVDGDGANEVFAETGEAGEIFAFHADGTPVAGEWPVTLEAVRTGKTVADLNQDGAAELICYAMTPKAGQRQRRLAVFDGAGVQLAEWPLDDCFRDVAAQRLFPAVGNFDRDADLEIVAVSGCGQLALFDLDRPEEPVWTTDLPTILHTSPVVGDVNGDGEEDVVIAGYDPRAGDEHGFAGGVFLVDRKGRVMTGWPVLIEQAFLDPPALGDVDGDGRLEIAVYSRKARQLHLLRADGFEAPGWPVVVSGYDSLRSAPLLADVDGDGFADVVATVNGIMSSFTYWGDKAALGGIRAWDRFGQGIEWPGDAITRVLPLEHTGGFSRSKSPAATFTDLDGNGLLDVVTSSIDDYAFSATSLHPESKRRYSLYAWELPRPFSGTNLLWPAFRHDAAHTGRVPGPVHTNQPPVLSPLPDQIVRTGDPFFPLPLRQYVRDPDHELGELVWTVEGATALRVDIGEDLVVRVAPWLADWEGSETVTFVVRDPDQAEARQSVTYTARRDYQPPVANRDVVAVVEDGEAEFDVLANDRQPRGLPLHVEAVSRPELGRVSILDDGRLRYTPKPDANGTDAFTYLLRDEEGGLALGEVVLDIAPVPDPPAPGDDHVITLEDTPVEVDLLANDEDPDGDPLALAAVTAPEHSRLIRLGAGRVRLEPEPDWSGGDAFSYTVTDGTGLESDAVVQLMVKPVNDPPVAEDQSYTLNRNSEQSVFYRAHDPDGDDLKFTVLDEPEHGELFAFPQVATYYPEKGFVGDDRITYQASDGRQDSRVATVTFHVIDANNLPVTKGQSLTNKVGRPLPVTLAATDADEDPLTFEISRAPLHGTMSGTGSNVVYAPELRYVGWDEFWFRAHDGRDFSPETKIAIYQTDQNTAPVAGEKEVSVRFNTATEVELPARDPESDPLTFRIVEPPGHGHLEGEGPQVVFVPDTDYRGPDQFTFVAGDGELESEPGVVRLTVEPGNVRPEAVDQKLELPADVESPVGLDVHDPDDDPLRVAILKGPQHGVLYGLGTHYVFRPQPGFHGADSFTYKAWDGYTYSLTAKVSFVVKAPPADTPRIEGVELGPDGQVHLRLRVRLRRSLAIERSPDLAQWEKVAELEPDQEEATWTDPDPPEAVRFYRLVEY